MNLMMEEKSHPLIIAKIFVIGNASHSHTNRYTHTRMQRHRHVENKNIKQSYIFQNESNRLEISIEKPFYSYFVRLFVIILLLLLLLLSLLEQFHLFSHPLYIIRSDKINCNSNNKTRLTHTHSHTYTACLLKLS